MSAARPFPRPPAGAGRIRRVLIANRGEIAVRIIRACRELGIETVQAHSQADRASLPVALADRAVCIGYARARDSYLNPTALVSAALVHGADAIHPGYGFLSERPDFAELCEQQGLVFIGPSSGVIRQMGDKAMARRLAAQAGVPTTPGSNGVLRDARHALEVAAGIGYPVLLKAVAGGGGRGMRVVADARSLAAAFAEASREASMAFGDGAMYLEKFLSQVRHIEIQVLGDGHDVIHLGERDCSTQRRNQKLIEESPSPVLDEDLRRSISEAALALARLVGYRSAGTMEFILDPVSRQFYFMEMNTRIQVEHPVTELVTGVDLVKEQIRIAGGLPLDLRQSSIRLTGHAIECRINAEDAARNFLPTPGVVERYHAPGGPGIRIDSHLFSGYEIPPYYDSLLGKLISWGTNRDEAIARMRRALAELRICGPCTTVGFHRMLLDTEAFRLGRIHTRYIEEELMPAMERAAAEHGPADG
ncbi:MAG: acetyl-CoA carboxylase biotin carboxylase subunit [Betaproteobacteria bacterium]|nr:acetyl-CoA carboxylase biotin carboxylase subunit [Betaproteobacteria bacterium]